MAGQKTITGTVSPIFNPAPPPPLPAYVVSGVTTPNCTGDYWLGGVYNSKNYYRRTDSHFFIWWHPPTNRHYISVGLGVLAPGCWEHESPTPPGTYNPVGTYFGNPLVT